MKLTLLGLVTLLTWACMCPLFVGARHKGRTSTNSTLSIKGGSKGSRSRNDMSKGKSSRKKGGGSNSARSPLQGPPCNEIIGIVTKEEIALIAGVWVQLVNSAGGLSLTPDQQAAALFAFLGGATTPKYDIVASKVCGSCADFVKEIKAADSTGAWEKYCGKHVYGYKAPQSALVFHPLDPDTGLPLTGVRNVGVAFQSTRITITDAFSTDFPVNVTQRALQELTDIGAFGTTFADAFPLMTAASLGLITYGVDLIGYGESAADFDRSYLTAVPVKQAAVVGYHATAKYSKDISNECTQVSDNVVSWGYSAGAASAVFGTVALEKQGLNIERHFSGAGVYDNSAFVQLLVGAALLDDTFVVGEAEVGFFGLAAASYSNEAPFLQNTGTGQTMLSQDSKDEMLAWIFDDKVTADELRALYPRNSEDFLATVNPNVFEPILAALSTPGSPTNRQFFCDEPFLTENTTALCATILANSAESVFDDITDYPFQWCHSPNDDTIPYALTLVTLVAKSKPNVVQYRAPLPFLEPFGNHGVGAILCHVAIPTFLNENPAFVAAGNVTSSKSGKRGKGSKTQCMLGNSAKSGGGKGSKSDGSRRRLRRVANGSWMN